MYKLRIINEDNVMRWKCPVCHAIPLEVPAKKCPLCGYEIGSALPVSSYKPLPVDSYDAIPPSSVFSFRGRIGRQEYWLIMLGLVEIYFFARIFLWIIEGVVSKEVASIFVVLSLLCLPILFWINLANQVKRWHDRGKSGWMVLIGLIPIIGEIWTLIELGFLSGTKGANKYGEGSPKVP